MSSDQMALNLNLDKGKVFESFYVGENESLLKTLYKAAKGRGEQFIYFWGRSGSGRTHLLHACCHEASDLKLTNLYLSLGDLKNLSPDIFENLESLSLICIDDLQGIVGQPEWERAFFNFYNAMHESAKRLIIAAEMPPKQLGIEMPDLVSRLSSGLMFQLHGLTEEQKEDALIQTAGQRGLMLPHEVVQFILHRYPRDTGALFDALNRLDHASLEAKRRLTIPFVKEVLGL